MEAVLVERPLRRRAEPHVVVHAGGRFAVGHARDVAHPVLVSPRLDDADLAEGAALHEVHRVGKCVELRCCVPIWTTRLCGGRR